MRGCGTVFNDDERRALIDRILKLERLAKNNPNEHEAASAFAKANELKLKLQQTVLEIEHQILEEQLRQIKRLAQKHEFIARHLRDAVAKCEASQTTEGLGEMVAFAFNAQQYEPRYGGGGSNLPPGKYKGVIVDSRQEKVERNGQVTGGYLALDLSPIEGPLSGQKHTDRLNLHHTNPQTVQIANQQMAAYCHVLGVYNIQDTSQLHNIPFLFEIGWQKGQEPTQEKPEGGYTEVKAIFDVNGNSPGKSGGHTQQQPQQPPQQMAPPPAGVAPQAQPPQQWGTPPQPQPQPQAQPQPQQPPQAQPGAWGAQQPQAQPQQPPQAPPQPQPAAWGAPPQPQPGAAPWGGAPGAAPIPPGWGG